MQQSLSPEEIIKYLKNNIEPLEDNFYGQNYRTSVYLTDGTYLPCVIFRNPSKKVNLAIKRFKEEKSGNGIFSKSLGVGYYNIVKSFITNGNCINHYDIAQVEKSLYAFPLQIQIQIHGETSMGWTRFAAKMKDGKCLGFGTRFNTEFFDMPSNYSVNDIAEIINHSYVLNTGELKHHRLANNEIKAFSADDYKNAIIYRERPFFECYMDNL